MDSTLVLVTLVSLTLAAVMAGLAWRLAREERRRSTARVAALAAEIRGNTLNHDLPLRGPSGARPEPAERREQPVAAMGDLFASAQPPASRSRSLVALGVLVVVGAAAVLAVLSSGAPLAPAARPTLVASGSGPAPAQPNDPAPSPAPVSPLELVALTHERDTTRLTVRGIIRNPVSGGEVSRLAAVVLIFNRDGGYVASGRAVVDAPTLVPGAEAGFVVTIADVSDVGRYRVSFRSDERVVPHVDRRDRTMAQVK